MRSRYAWAASDSNHSEIERAISLLRDNEQVRSEFNASIRLTKDVEGKCIKPFLVNLFDEAKRKLAAENVDVRGARIRTDNFVKRILSAFCQTLNERPWNVVSKTVTSSIGGSPVELRSTIAPAAQKGLFRSIALEGGNFEVQKMNTGLAGFKTGGVDSIVERLGGKKYRNLHSGGSDFVKV